MKRDLAVVAVVAALICFGGPGEGRGAGEEAQGAEERGTGAGAGQGQAHGFRNRASPGIVAAAHVPEARTWDPRGFRISAPHFADPDQRARFKAWWTEELLRRIAAWERAHPRQDGYPSQAWTRGLLDRLYDAAEEGTADEPESQVQARVAAGLQIMDELAAAYGESLSSIANQVMDDADLEPPPLLPPGWSISVTADDPPPLPPAPRPSTLPPPPGSRRSPSPIPLP